MTVKRAETLSLSLWRVILPTWHILGWPSHWKPGLVLDHDWWNLSLCLRDCFLFANLLDVFGQNHKKTEASLRVYLLQHLVLLPLTFWSLVHHFIVSCAFVAYQFFINTGDFQSIVLVSVFYSLLLYKEKDVHDCVCQTYSFTFLSSCPFSVPSTARNTVFSVKHGPTGITA